LLLRVRRGKEGLEGKLLSEGDTQEGPEESAEMLNRALITRTFDGIAGLPGGESELVEALATGRGARG